MASSDYFNWITGQAPHYFRNCETGDIMSFQDFMTNICNLCVQYKTFLCFYHVKEIDKLALVSRWNHGIFFGQNWNAAETDSSYIDCGVLLDFNLSDVGGEGYITRIFTVRADFSVSPPTFSLYTTKKIKYE